MPRMTLCTGVNFGVISPIRPSAAGTTSDSANAPKASADSQRSTMYIFPLVGHRRDVRVDRVVRVVALVARHLPDHVVVDVRAGVDLDLQDHGGVTAPAFRNHVVHLVHLRLALRCFYLLERRAEARLEERRCVLRRLPDVHDEDAVVRLAAHVKDQPLWRRVVVDR